MKLHTDPGNFQTLKLIIAAELSETSLEIVETKFDEHVVPYLSTNKLPVLEVYPDKFIFSVNSAARYLIKKDGTDDSDSSLLDHWLEWEAGELQPVLFPYLVSIIGQNKLDDSCQVLLLKYLDELDKQLDGKAFLAGTALSAADVVVWASLFPVLTGKKALKDWDSQLTNVGSWFSHLSSIGAFQTAVNKIMKCADTSVFKASLLAQPLPHAPSSLKCNVHVSQSAKSGAGKPPSCSDDGLSLSEKSFTAKELSDAADAWINGIKQCPKPRQLANPVLPIEGERNILVTSALPYVNNIPHLGNIIGCVLSADVFTRFCRLRNYNILYICGTDEYGTATETKAIEEGLTPRQICDKYNAIHSDVYKWFNIEFDYFGRTTTEQQTHIAQDIFWKLYERGFILQDKMEQLQCEQCDRFLADRFVEGTCPLCAYEDARGDQCDGCQKLINATELKSPRCKMCGNSPIIKSSNHLFLNLPKIEPLLTDHLDKVFQSGTWTSNAKIITSSWIRNGLKPRCISRDLKWGIPIPLEGYTDKVFYVWFDAPIGYISITANYTDQWEKWWKNQAQVEMYNFLGKDNVPFHSVIFPCTLLGSNDNYTVVNHMSATEYLNYEDGKFSKSRGVGIFGHQAKETGIPSDIYRFYLLYIRPESQDTNFSWEDFQVKNNSELLNNLGNFINRALMFVSNSFESTIQDVVLTEEDHVLLAAINRELLVYIENMENVRLRDSLRNILNMSRAGNQYMQANKPWVLVKGQNSERQRAGSVVSLAANLACLLSVLLQPFMPDTSTTIQEQLAAPKDCNVISTNFVCHLKPGHKMGKPSPLFEKLMPCKMDALLGMFAGQKSGVKAAEKPSRKEKGKPSEINGRVPDEHKLISENGPVSPQEVQRLTDEVATQGNVVKELKTNKAEKSLIDAEVSKLLDLKRQLAVAQGIDPESLIGGGKKKGKKKK